MHQQMKAYNDMWILWESWDLNFPFVRERKPFSILSRMIWAKCPACKYNEDNVLLELVSGDQGDTLGGIDKKSSNPWQSSGYTGSQQLSNKTHTYYFFPAPPWSWQIYVLFYGLKAAIPSKVMHYARLSWCMLLKHCDPSYARGKG